jgi:copper homeostasis protein
MKLEICVDNFESLKTAVQHGADRIELCASLQEGGLTPSSAFIQAAMKVDIPVFVMIRPRSCDFLYTSQEIEMMHQDIHFAKKSGAPGVVFGVLTADGRIDVDAMRSLIKQAEGLAVTCHRAIDQVEDLFATVDVLAELSVNRILTTGGFENPFSGIPTLAKMVVRAQKRVRIMAAGVTPCDVREIIIRTGVDEVHSAAACTRPSRMNYIQGTPKMGQGDDFSLNIVDGQIVQAIKSQIKNL